MESLSASAFIREGKVIGIAVCYTDPVQFEKLSADIRKSCGREYRLVGLDNRNGEYDIFSAYKKLTGEIQSEIMVFCHQDICFCTENWGDLLEKYFAEHSQLGAVGVAGGSAHPRSPGGWMTAPPCCERCINIIQHTPDGKRVSDRTVTDGRELYPVTVIDGVFMAFRGSVFSEVSFGNSGLSGFHGYDLDISLQLLRHGWKIAVTSEILLEHFSAGSYSPQYIHNIVAVHLANRDILPVFAGEFPASQHALKEYETRSLLFFAYTMRSSGVSGKEFRRILLMFRRDTTFFCKCFLLLLWEFLRSFF